MDKLKLWSGWYSSQGWGELVNCTMHFQQSIERRVRCLCSQTSGAFWQCGPYRDGRHVQSRITYSFLETEDLPFSWYHTYSGQRKTSFLTHISFLCIACLCLKKKKGVYPKFSILNFHEIMEKHTWNCKKQYLQSKNTVPRKDILNKWWHNTSFSEKQ